MMWITRNTIHLIRIGIVFSTFQQPINALQGINKCPFGVKDKLTIHGCYAAAQGEHKVRQLFMFVHKNLIWLDNIIISTMRIIGHHNVYVTYFPTKDP